MGVAFSTNYNDRTRVVLTVIRFGHSLPHLLFWIIGSIGLLMKKKSKTCIYYFASCHHNTNDSHFFTNAKEVYGAGTEVMPTSHCLWCFSIMVFTLN
jgi:hypothetical protein